MAIARRSARYSKSTTCNATPSARTWWGKRPDAVTCVRDERPEGPRVRCYGYYVRDASGRRRVDSTDVLRTGQTP